MEHRFYIKSKREQFRIQLLIAVSSLAVVLLSIFVAWRTGFYLIAIFTISIVLSIIAPFFDIPSLKRSGKLIYHSPMFISERIQKGVIKIHGGSLLDYVFVIKKKMNGNQRTILILHQYLEGLLHLIEQYETTKQADLKIRGTSYIVNERTAERIGFKVIKKDFFQNLILTFNFFNILIMNSIAKDKLVFPKLQDIKTFEANLNVLIQQKNYINNLNNKLKRTIVNIQ